jgi:hypothetical protein
MKYHELKTWTKYYNELMSGKKTFEVRKNDRGFLVGDTLYLREYDPAFRIYTGRWSLWTITYLVDLKEITDCNADVPYVVISIKKTVLHKRSKRDIHVN